MSQVGVLLAELRENTLMKNRTLLLTAMIFSLNATAEAHHNVRKVYKITETTSIEGKVVRFLFRNPHSYIFLREAGSLEWASRKKLSRHGIQAKYRILLQLLTRQNDGFSWGERKNETVD
jgi:uncharacterized protein DUF6152